MKKQNFENVIEKKNKSFCFVSASPTLSCEHTNILPNVAYRFELPCLGCVKNELWPSVGILDSCLDGNLVEYAAALLQPGVPVLFLKENSSSGLYLISDVVPKS